MWLSTIWSCKLKTIIECYKSDEISKAELIKGNEFHKYVALFLLQVTPQPNNGNDELVELRRTPIKSGGIELWFEFQKVKYYLSPDTLQFQTRIYPINKPLSVFYSSSGYQKQHELDQADRFYERNAMEMELPSFKELFIERATAPFFVFQVFCVGLWCLDEYWYYSIFTLLMLVMFECTLVKQQLRNMKEIRNMGNSTRLILCYRLGKWTQVKTDELLPGDIVSLRSQPTLAVSKNSKGPQRGNQSQLRVPSPEDDEGVLSPCDLILLSGRLVCDEALLTGESVPQVKEGIETLNLVESLDEKDHQVAIISGGTKMMQHIQSTEVSNTPGPLRPTDKGCPAIVLRTGFSTTQGSLLRTILYGSKRVTANNAETGCFILILLCFAIAAATNLWIEGTKNPERSRYKLMLECTFILTSVVPPELPIQLSLAVNSSLLALSKLGLFCTEPFRIPFAGKVDIVCFDKTGTLTQDKLFVKGVAGLFNDDPALIVEAKEVPEETLRVLAGAHSLHMGTEQTGIIGDPLEISILEDIEWTLKGDNLMPLNKNKSKVKEFKIEKKFHFSSALARMSTIVKTETLNGNCYHSVVKGSADQIRKRINQIPPWYDVVHTKLAKEGNRVLALASKKMNFETRAQMVTVGREEVESGLEFNGFLVTGSSLKEDAIAVVDELISSSHYVTMITGDALLTAIHVARVTRILDNPTVLLLERKENGAEISYHWRNEDAPSKIFPAESPPATAALCVTGPGLLWLTEKCPQMISNIIPRIRVFARTSPKQKESIIQELKAGGFYTVMCGDGTNDVGALKHSHVGVALLASSVGEKLEKQREFMQKRRQAAMMMRAPRTRQEAQKAELEKLMKELEEMEGPGVVQLGDASIAAPFTSRKPTPAAVLHVIRQGRCTLVTTLQMFSILALNSLISAYSQSALYLKVHFITSITTSLHSLRE